ncbi:MAG: lipoprotein, partial [Oscillospiraceae bacterium]|nr:lipoprotein [Oscillospiraceae bacterium]
MKKIKKLQGILISALVFTLVLTGCSSISENYSDGTDIIKLSEEDADDTLASWIKKLNPKRYDPPVDLDTTDKYIEELPDIDTTFKFSVTGNRLVNVEIWASTEKSGEGNDGWINRVAESFNNQNYTLADGRTVSVSIRSIDAGNSLDYITKGKNIPDA